jgi:predicted Rossmann fold nucleotide-binding protein DprA/Smf involved in DNA uptake
MQECKKGHKKMEAKNLLIYLCAYKYKTTRAEKKAGMEDKYNWDKVYQHIAEKKPLSDREKNFIETFATSFKQEFDVIAITDSEYPNELKTMCKPPFVIWKKKDNLGYPYYDCWGGIYWKLYYFPKH